MKATEVERGVAASRGIAICIVVLLAMALWRAPERRFNVLLITLDTTHADRLGC